MWPCSAERSCKFAGFLGREEGLHTQGHGEGVGEEAGEGERGGDNNREGCKEREIAPSTWRAEWGKINRSQRGGVARENTHPECAAIFRERCPPSGSNSLRELKTLSMPKDSHNMGILHMQHCRGSHTVNHLNNKYSRYVLTMLIHVHCCESSPSNAVVSSHLPMLSNRRGTHACHMTRCYAC